MICEQDHNFGFKTFSSASRDGLETSNKPPDCLLADLE